jgi:hypothetical protein
MKEKEQKSPCCNAEILRKYKLMYVCKSCEKDITLDLYFIWESEQQND